MLSIFVKPAPSLALICTLAACGDIKGALEFADQRDEFRDRRDMLDSRFNTAWDAVPDTDTATYFGEASLGAGDLNDGIAIIGDAAMSVDFDAGTVNGTLNNFGGFDRTQEYSDYSGSLIFETGVIGVDRPNDLEASITGTLTGEDYVLDVDAFWEGDFKGTPIVGILGDTSGSQSTFILNDELVVGGIIIAVTN